VVEVIIKLVTVPELLSALLPGVRGVDAVSNALEEAAAFYAQVFGGEIRPHAAWPCFWTTEMSTAPFLNAALDNGQVRRTA
jgi:hypothetical protein